MLSGVNFALDSYDGQSVCPLTCIKSKKEGWLTMDNTMLGQALEEIARLLKDLWGKLAGKEGLVYFEELKKFLRKEPCWAEGMVYPPLEWSYDMVCVEKKDLRDSIERHFAKKGSRWRIPSVEELTLALETSPEQFSEDMYYWTATLCDNSGGFFLIKMKNGRIILSSTVFVDGNQKFPHLKLCREIKLPQ